MRCQQDDDDAFGALFKVWTMVTDPVNRVSLDLWATSNIFRTDHSSSGWLPIVICLSTLSQPPDALLQDYEDMLPGAYFVCHSRH
jgi:hypothetical protein